MPNINLKKIFADDPEALKILETRENTDAIKELIAETKKSREEAFKGIAQLKGDPGEKGEDGYTPIKGIDYFDGEDGPSGKDGINGTTPIKGVDYFDGEDGYTPIKGVDYFTPKEIEQFKSDVTPKKGLDYFDGKDGESVSVADVIVELKKKQYLEPKDIKGMPIDMSDMRWHGAGLSSVVHDGTLTGNGTGSSPLSVIGGGGSPAGSNGDLQVNASGSFGTIGGLNLDQTGNARGLLALDIQSQRVLTTQVASGGSSVAVGSLNTASGAAAIVFGRSNTATNSSSISIGAGNNVTGISAMAVGKTNTVSGTGADAFGTSNTVSGTNSSAIGISNTVSSNSSHAFGQSLDIDTSNHVRIGYGTSTTWLDIEASGNLTTAGLGGFGVDTSGRISGDGSLLTNIPATNPFDQSLNTTDSVQFNLATIASLSSDGGLITTDGSGALTAVSFGGDGSLLTGLSWDNITNGTQGSIVLSGFTNDSGFITGTDVPSYEQDPVYTSWYNSGSPSLNAINLPGGAISGDGTYINITASINFSGDLIGPTDIWHIGTGGLGRFNTLTLTGVPSTPGSTGEVFETDIGTAIASNYNVLCIVQ